MSPPIAVSARIARSLAAALLLCGCARDEGPPGDHSSASGAPAAESPARARQDGNDAGAGGALGPLSLQAGLDLFRQGDLNGAEPHLVAALRAAPRDRRLLEILGSIYARTDRWRQAEESFRTALAVEPGSIGARLGLAAVCVDTGRYDEASAILADVQRRDPANPVARLKRALLDARLGRAAQAEQGAREAIAQNPSSPEAHYVLGLTLLSKGVPEQAAGEMRRAHELQPGHLGALNHLVTIETRLHHPAEAARWRKEQQTALGRMHVEERVRDHRIKGVAAFNGEDYTTALEEFRAIAREDPRDPQVHLHLGSTYLALGKMEEARRELDLCLSLEPRNERALAELGRAQAMSNRLDEAIESFRKAIAINPHLAEPHYYLAGVYMARGERDRYQEEMKIFSDLQARSQGAALEVQPGKEP